MFVLFRLFVGWLEYGGWFRVCLFCVLILGFALVVGYVFAVALVCGFVVLPLTAFATVVAFAVAWFLLSLMLRWFLLIVLYCIVLVFMSLCCIV